MDPEPSQHRFRHHEITWPVADRPSLPFGVQIRFHLHQTHCAGSHSLKQRRFTGLSSDQSNTIRVRKGTFWQYQTAHFR